MYRRSNMFFTLSFIHLVSTMVIAYNIYVNRFLFENEDSIIFCKQSVADRCRVCENSCKLIPLATSGCHKCHSGRVSPQSAGLFRACGAAAHPPSASLCSGCAALSCCKSSALRALAGKVRECRLIHGCRQNKAPAVAGALFCWIPAATYSPGPLPVKYHRRMKA